MKKELQAKVNEKVLYAYKDYMHKRNTPYNHGRLYTCNAHIEYVDGYIGLVSYDTLVACIDENTGILYDFLRAVYGYTATSAQHIAKFARKYGIDYNKIERYYNI